jgi:hypothetical protein
MDGPLPTVQVQFLRTWIENRRAFLIERRENAPTPEKKEVFAAMLRELSEYEQGILQAQIIGESIIVEDTSIVPENYEIAGALLLAYLGLPPSSISQFRNNHWREDLKKRFPQKGVEIQIMNRFSIENDLIKVLLKMIISRHTFPQNNNATLVCPTCNRVFHYAKSLTKHILICPKKKPAKKD